MLFLFTLLGCRARSPGEDRTLIFVTIIITTITTIISIMKMIIIIIIIII